MLLHKLYVPPSPAQRSREGLRRLRPSGGDGGGGGRCHAAASTPPAATLLCVRAARRLATAPVPAFSSIDSTNTASIQPAMPACTEGVRCTPVDSKLSGSGGRTVASALLPPPGNRSRLHASSPRAAARAAAGCQRHTDPPRHPRTKRCRLGRALHRRRRRQSHHKCCTCRCRLARRRRCGRWREARPARRRCRLHCHRSLRCCCRRHVAP